VELGGAQAALSTRRAHRRLLSALEALARVRKLALPALQVNIGQDQVNMA
jgi:hypothetical protein